MMQAAQSRDRNDSAIGRRILFDVASPRGFFAKAEVGAVLVIAGDVRVHESLQMALVHDKHMVEQVPTAIADEALRDPVLPWALKACSLGLNTEALDRINHMVIEVRATIKYEIARRRVVRKHLLRLGSFVPAAASRGRPTFGPQSKLLRSSHRYLRWED